MEQAATYGSAPDPADAGSRDAASDGDDSFGDPKLATFFEHWRARMGAAGWPRRGDLDPVAIPRLLPHLMITESGADGSETLRLVGTHIVDHLGFDPTRRDLRAMAGDGNFADLSLDLLAEMRAAGAPLLADGRHITPFGATRTCRRVICPLNEESVGVDATVSCIVFSADAAAEPIAAGGTAVRDRAVSLPIRPAAAA